MKNKSSLFLGILVIVIYVGGITGLVILFDLAKANIALAKWVVFSFTSIGAVIGLWGLWKIIHLWKTNKNRLREHLVMVFLIIIILGGLWFYKFISTIVLETTYDLVRFQLSDFWWGWLNWLIVITILVLIVYLVLYIFHFVSKTLLPKNHKWEH